MSTASDAQPDPSPSMDDVLDRLVSEYADALQGGGDPDPDPYLQRVPEAHRDALHRCLRMLRTGGSVVPASAAVLGPGSTLDHFRIEREIGRGGMATVYLALDEQLRRPVALKVLRPGLAADGRHVDRFEREARAVAKLQHPHIVAVHGVGAADGHHYIAMEYVEGGTLSEALGRLPGGPEKARHWTAADLAEATHNAGLAQPGYSFEMAVAEMLAPVVRAIAVAHELGLVHRDIKPSNILLRSNGQAKIADFGLAKAAEDPALSLTGEPLGTPFYMSPEQAALTSHRVDERTDVYSLGVTLYECLAGVRPFEGATALAVLDAIRSGAPTPLGTAVPGRSVDAAAVVQRAMARMPDERYATAMDLAADLTALVSCRPTQAIVARGGLWTRVRAGLKAMSKGHGCEYISPRQFWGIPLVHINFRRRMPGDKLRRAKGWFAMADIAVGGVAIAPFAAGGLALGSVTCGLVSLAGMATGLYSLGGVSVGIFATGGAAVGYHAFGGLAVGVHAIGGLAISMESMAVSKYALEGSMPWFRWLLNLR